MSMFYVNKAKEIRVAKGLTFAADNALAEKTPVNAVAASGVVTFTGTPLVHVPNSQGAGTITISGTPVADETLVVNGITLTFKAAPTLTHEVQVSADHGVVADSIADKINADPLFWCDAVAGADAVVLTTRVTDAIGTASNLVLTENATGVAVSGAGTFTGGINHVHESLQIGSDEFIFVTARSGVGSFEVTVSANNTTQADNLVAAINADSAEVVATNIAGVVTITAATKGALGNSIDLNEDAYPVTGAAISSVTSKCLDNGIDGTIGAANEICADGTYLYHCVAANGTPDRNWRRVALGSAY